VARGKDECFTQLMCLISLSKALFLFLWGLLANRGNSSLSNVRLDIFQKGGLGKNVNFFEATFGFF